MAINQRGDSFEVYVKVNDRRFRRSFKTEAMANAVEKHVRECLEAGREPNLDEIALMSDDGSRTLVQVKDVLIRTPPQRGGRGGWAGIASAYKQIGNIEEVIEIIGPNRGINTLVQADVDRVIEVLSTKGNSNSTINRKLSALSKLVSNFAGRRGWYTGPKLDLAHLPENVGRIRYLVGDEETNLLTMTNHLGSPEFSDFWTCLIDTGARPFSELVWVEPGDVTDRQVTFWGRNGKGTKNGECRTVPLTRRASGIFQRRLRETNGRPFPFTMDEAHRVWSRVRSLLKFDEDPQWVIYMLRHTCASRLAQRGVPLQVIKEWMGHKTIQVTLRYAHLCPSNLTQAMMALELPEAAE